MMEYVIGGCVGAFLMLAFYELAMIPAMYLRK